MGLLPFGNRRGQRFYLLFFSDPFLFYTAKKKRVRTPKEKAVTLCRKRYGNSWAVNESLFFYGRLGRLAWRRSAAAPFYFQGRRPSRKEKQEVSDN